MPFLMPSKSMPSSSKSGGSNLKAVSTLPCSCSLVSLVSNTTNVNKRNIRQIHFKKDERNISAIKMISKDHIFSELIEVKRDLQVVKLEVEDLLVSQHKTLLPVVRGLVVAGQRDWQWVRLTDSFSAHEFFQWHQAKSSVMHDFNGADSAVKKIVNFHAELQLSPGTSVETLQAIFQVLCHDLTITTMTFGGAFQSKDSTLIASLLAKNLVKNQLVENASLSFECGWSNATAQTHLQHHKMVIDSCLYLLDMLSHPKSTEKVATAGLERSLSMPPRATGVRRHRCLRKTQSIDKFEENMQRRGEERRALFYREAMAATQAAVRGDGSMCSSSHSSSTTESHSSSCCSSRSSSAIIRENEIPDYDWTTGTYTYINDTSESNGRAKAA